MKRKVIIIGGGIAGLSAGIYCQANGYDSEIFEMSPALGGQCTAWKRSGYLFDYCLHWLVGTAKGPFNKVWKETSVITDSVKIIDHEIYTQLVDKSEGSFLVYTDLDRWEKYLIEFAPEDEITIKKMCGQIRTLSLLEPFESPPELRKAREYISTAIKSPRAMLLMMKYAGVGFVEYVNQLGIKNKRLKFFLSKVVVSGDFSALAFLMMFGWFHSKNAGYLIGGSSELISRMTERYKSLGGKISVNAKVQRINVAGSHVTGISLADGTSQTADRIISAADGHSTIFTLLNGMFLTDKIKEAYSSWPLFTSIVQVSFGVHASITADFPVQTVLSSGEVIGQTILSNGFSIMNYSHDSSMAPPGKSVITIRYESPYCLWQHMSSSEYALEKKRISEDSRALLERHMPGIGKHIEAVDVATPLTDVRYTGVWKGAYEGFLPSYKNIWKRIECSLPGLHNFYMCGQWLAPGGGLPPAAQSGKWAVQLMCHKDGIKFG